MKKVAIYNVLIIISILITLTAMMTVDNHPGAGWLVFFGAITAYSWNEDKEQLLIEQENEFWEGTGND